MIKHEDIVTFDIYQTELSLILYQALMKEMTVGNGGAHYSFKSTEHKSKHERQVTGYMGECAMFLHYYGTQGMTLFNEYRMHYNRDPHKPDDGHDFKGVDIKTRRLIRTGSNANFHRFPINNNILNFECIVRPVNAYSPDHRYLMIIVEYEDSLLQGVLNKATINLVGWGYLRDAIYYPDGQTGIKKAHYALQTNKMYPIKQLIEEFKSNER